MFFMHQMKKDKKRRLYHRASVRSTGARDGHFPIKALLGVFLVVVFLWMIRWLLQLCFFGGRFFWKTIPGPKIERIEVHAGDTITAPILLDYLKIEKGMPLFDHSHSIFGTLFSCDIREKQRLLLEKAPTLASATITRRMPDTIVISVTERVPVARLARSALGIDRNGILFVSRHGMEGLPSVCLKKSSSPRRAGDRLGRKFSEGVLADATLELIDALASGDCRLSMNDLVSVDLSKIDYLECLFANRSRVKLAWTEMGKGSSYGRRCLIAQLNGLADAMNSPRAHGRFHFDVTIPGRCFAY